MILGAMLESEETLVLALDLVTAEDFYLDRHKKIFNAIIDLYQDGTPVDLVTFTDHLREKGILEECGGVTYTIEILGLKTFARSLLKRHAEIVKNKALLRRIEALGASVAAKASEPGDGRALLTELEGGLLNLSSMMVERRSPEVGVILSEIEEDWRKIEAGGSVGVPTNKALISSAIPFWSPGRMTVIGGYTSSGKSTVLAQIVLDACRLGATVIIFSTEDGRREKLLKIMANITNIPQKSLLTRSFSEYDRGVIESAKREMKEFDLLTYDDVYDIDEMRLRIKKERLRRPIHLVVLDYIQNVQAEGDIYERMSMAAPKLYRIGKELEYHSIVASQVSNESMKGDSGVIGFKGAGDIAATTDAAISIKRNKGSGNERQLDFAILKNREFGETGVSYLKFSERWTRIEPDMQRILG